MMRGRWLGFARFMKQPAKAGAAAAKPSVRVAQNTTFGRLCEFHRHQRIRQSVRRSGPVLNLVTSTRVCLSSGEHVDMASHLRSTCTSTWDNAYGLPCLRLNNQPPDHYLNVVSYLLLTFSTSTTLCRRTCLHVRS